MIRAFITSWIYIPEESRVTHSIAEVYDAVCPNVPATISMFYPDADANGLPDGPHVLIFIESESPAIEQLDTLDGVYMFPPHSFNAPMADVSQAVKDEVLTLCSVNNWMPVDPLFTAETYGDCLRLLAKSFQIGFVSFGKYEVERAAEFG